MNVVAYERICFQWNCPKCGLGSLESRLIRVPKQVTCVCGERVTIERLSYAQCPAEFPTREGDQ